MSSNTQVHTVAVPVGGKTAIAVGDLIHAGGAEKMKELLRGLPTIVAQLPVEQRAEFEWQMIGESKWKTTVGSADVMLSIPGALAELTVSGQCWLPEGDRGEAESRQTMQQAAKKVNNLFALTVATHLAQRLDKYVEQKAGQKIRQSIKLRALATQKQRTAIRATTSVRLKMR